MPFLKLLRSGWIVFLSLAAVSTATAARDEFTEAQIQVLQSGKPDALNAVQINSRAELTAAKWTIYTAQLLHREKGISISRDSALLTSEMIAKGCERFWKEQRPEGEEGALGRLTRFVNLLLESARLENGKIGETTFIKAQASLCPAWPFC
jgi:hypothetical protein